MIARRVSAGIAAVLLLVFPLSVHCETFNLPWTGQIVSYGPNDDGATLAGVAWPIPRFTVTYCDATGPCADQTADCDGNSSNDMVLDELTGLMWARNANLLITESGAWGVSLSAANDLVLCGHNDWRMPNLNELESLINAGASDSAAWLNSQGFNGVQNRYWSSTSNAENTLKAFVVSMDGAVFTLTKSSALTANMWPVRAGQ